jgi:hypothetical protein
MYRQYPPVTNKHFIINICDELNDLYCSLNISRVIKSRRMRWAGHVARRWILVGKLEVKRLLGRTRHRWEDNIKMFLQEVGCEGMD